jgi:pimeloyl-ACP methyl ester carboxylesterase
VPALSARFQLVLIDLRDQGQSSRMKEDYDLDVHVGDLTKLLDERRLARVHLLGLSYGGSVALRFAFAHQDRLATLLLPNTTSFIPKHLQQIGRAWEVASELNDGERFFQLAVPFIYSGTFYEKQFEALVQRQAMFKSMLTKEWFEGFRRLSRSTRDFSVSPEQLRTIRVPTLLIGADHDILTPIRRMETLHENIEGSEFVVIHDAGHGAFLEKMREFLTVVIGFATKHSAVPAPSGA